MPKSKSEFITINLGSIQIPRTIWERAKRINGYTREDIRQVIIQNGEDSLVDSIDSIDSNDFCEHNIAASEGCATCLRLDEERDSSNE